MDEKIAVISIMAGIGFLGYLVYKQQKDIVVIEETQPKFNFVSGGLSFAAGAGTLYLVQQAGSIKSYIGEKMSIFPFN